MDAADIPDVIKWYFVWTDGEEVEFDPATMNRNDEFVVECTVEQTQGGHAVCSLTIFNPSIGLYNTDRKQWAYIAAAMWDGAQMTVVPWYKLFCEAWPQQGDGVLTQLSLIAMPSDWTDRQEAALSQIRMGPWYDPAFIGSRDPVTQPEVNLEGRPALVHCHPLTHEAEVVSVIDAPRVLDIGTAWVGDTLNINDGSKEALDAVVVDMSVRWRQPVNVIFPVTAFGTTLTPQALYRTLYKPNSSPAPGYRVLVQNVNFKVEAIPGQPGSIMISSAGVTRSGALGDVGIPANNGPAPSNQFIASWNFVYAISMAVSYEYQREERYRFTLAWNGQKTSRTIGPVRSETIPLQISMEDAAGERWKPFRSRREGDITSYGGLAYRALKDRDEGLETFADELNYVDPDTGVLDPYWERSTVASDIRNGSTFFGTDRGVEALKHGVLAAQARLAVSRSACKTTFDLIKPGLGLQIDCGMMIRANSVKIGGDDTVFGKVERWALRIDKDGARFNVQLSSVPGLGDEGANDGDGENRLIESKHVQIDGNGNVFYRGNTDWAGIYPPFKTDYPAQRPAWWPAGRSWPPTLAEDTFGVYTHGQSERFQDGTSDIYVPEGRDRPLPAIPDPYAAAFPAQKPSWWPKIGNPYANFVAGQPYSGPFVYVGEDVFAWPPGGVPPTSDYFSSYFFASTDPFQFHRVPPERDEFDGSGGDRAYLFNPDGTFNGVPYSYEDDFGSFSIAAAEDEADLIVPASDQLWDRIPLYQTVVPFIPSPPASYFANPRVAQPSDEPEYDTGEIIPGGIEVRYPGQEQANILISPGHPHWTKVQQNPANTDPFELNALPDPLPGSADPQNPFDAVKALEKMETQVILHLVPVNNLSSSIRFEAYGKWNGPKHVDLGASKS